MARYWNEIVGARRRVTSWLPPFRVHLRRPYGCLRERLILNVVPGPQRMGAPMRASEYLVDMQ